MSFYEKMKAIADAIRSKTGKTGTLNLDQIKTGINEVYQCGKKSAYDEFWDAFQKNGTRTNYVGAFGSQWTPELFKPKYSIRPTNAYFMFFNNAGEKLFIEDFVEFCQENNFELDFSQCTNGAYAIGCLHSKHFGTLDFSKCTNLNPLFYSHNSTTGVQKIDNFISSEKTVFATGTFQHAIYLTDISMSGIVSCDINFGYSPLNKTSIKSVVNVLSSTTTNKTVTFKKSAVNSAFGINVDDATTYPEGSEFYTLRHSKDNWTFSYI